MKAQTPAAQALVAFSTAGHATLHAPQWVTFESGSTHASPQRSGAAGVHPLVHWKVAPVGVHRGAGSAHAALHAPQLTAFERSVSHPSAALALQSEYPASHAATTHAPSWQPSAAWAPGQRVQVGSPQP
jgi:hypothetical protein